MLPAVDDESLEPPQPPDNARNKAEDSILCVAIENGDSMDVASSMTSWHVWQASTNG
jgi:hypothetical protein